MSAPHVPDLQQIPPEVDPAETTGVGDQIEHPQYDSPLLHSSQAAASPLKKHSDGYTQLQDAEHLDQLHSEEATLAESKRNSIHDAKPITSSTIVRPWSHRASRKFLMATGANRLGVTLLLCLLIGLTLRAYEGFDDDHPRVLSSLEAKTFNAIMLGLSLVQLIMVLGLGLNLASSLKLYGLLLRWSILTRDYVPLQVFDLVLGCESLTKVFKLMMISTPGIERLPLLKYLPFFHPRKDGSRYTALVCLCWLLINLGAQILVATLSIFWPVDPSNGMPLLTTGDVMVANMSSWQGGGSPGTQMASANAYGMAGSEYLVAEGEDPDDPLNSNGASIYHGPDYYEYSFLNRNAKNPNSDFVLSARKIRARSVCEQYTLTYRSGDPFTQNGTLAVKGSLNSGEMIETWPILHIVKGMLSWTGIVNTTCGPRCTTLIVYQRRNAKNIAANSMFKCNTTMDAVTGQDKPEFTNLQKEDHEAIYTSDDFARLAAGAIAWSGYFEDRMDYFQCRIYMAGLHFIPNEMVNTTDVENILSRFSIGAIAAFDMSGPRYTIKNQHNRPVQGQRLNPDWSTILVILAWIVILQFGALMALLTFANKSIIRDDSFLSMAMLLRGVIERIPKEEGTNLSGEQIFTHPNLWGERIKYDYTKDIIQDDKGVRKIKKVAIRFEDQNDPKRWKKKRKWADGEYI